MYLADRGYEQYALYNAVVAAGSDYVIRGQDRPAAVAEERLLSDAAVAARVVSDAVVRLTASARTAAALDHPVRRVVVAGRDQGRPRGDRPEAGEVVIYTSLLGPPAEVIAAVYALRWSIEIYQADCTSRRVWVCAGRISYHRRDGVARTGRVVPATSGRPHRRSRMSDITRRPTPPRA